VVLTVSAIGGILIVLERGRQEGRRATVDLVVEQKRDAELVAARICINSMKEKHESNFAKYLEFPGSVEYGHILYALNTYEFVAVGIKTKAFSERTYKRLRCSTFIADWECFQGFVTEFRKKKGKQTLFQDSEWLYKRWKAKPLKVLPQ
jgi:hypothetical protein